MFFVVFVVFVVLLVFVVQRRVTAAPTLAIVIVSYNTRADLVGCLESLRANSPSCAHEVVVVDNGSTDDSVAAVGAGFPDVQVIEAGANLGFSRANNVGIRATRGALVLLLNSDTVVRSGALDRLVAALMAAPDAAVAGPRLVDAEGRAELSYGRMIGPFSETWQKLLVRGHARGWPLVASSVERRTRRGGPVDWVSGACLLARRADLEAVGLLDERFFMYTEDVDLCAMLRGRGRRILFVPAVTITHLRGRSAATAPHATRALYRRSHVAFYEKHHPGWAPWLRLYLRLRGQAPE